MGSGQNRLLQNHSLMPRTRTAKPRAGFGIIKRWFAIRLPTARHIAHRDCHPDSTHVNSPDDFRTALQVKIDSRKAGRSIVQSASI